MPLIKTVKDLDQAQKERRGQQLRCASCEQPISFPPAILVKPSGEDQAYHVKCAMDLMYDILTTLSGYGPEAKPIQPSMDDAFRAARQSRSPES